MTDISLKINEDLLQKLAKIAEKSGQNVNEVAISALSAYVEDYEDVYKTDLTDLCSVDNLERSFFLSIGE